MRISCNHFFNVGDGGDGVADMKVTDVADLTECKERCKRDACGAFVVTGDVCRFCPRKVPKGIKGLPLKRGMSSLSGWKWVEMGRG